MRIAELLWGILTTAGLGWRFGIAPAPKGLMAIPHFLVYLFGHAFTGFQYFTPSQMGHLIAAVFILLFVSLFDSIGTLMGLGQQAGRLNADGELPCFRQSLLTLRSDHSWVFPHCALLGVCCWHCGRRTQWVFLRHRERFTVSLCPVFAAVCGCARLCHCTRSDSGRRFNRR